MTFAKERSSLGLDADVAAAERATEAVVRGELAQRLEKVQQQLAQERQKREDDSAAHRQCLIRRLCLHAGPSEVLS